MFEAYGNINNPDPAVTRILVLDSTSFLRAAVAVFGDDSRMELRSYAVILVGLG